MGRISVSLDESNSEWVHEQAGADVEAYVNRVLQEERAHQKKLAELKQAIQDGLDSGVSERSIEDIWAEAEARADAKHGKISNIA